MPWLRTEGEKKGYDIIIPTMPDTNHPRVGPWVKMIQDTVGEPRPDDIFIGHSLGCIAIIRYLETLQVGESVGQCIFVASFFEDLGDQFAELRSFLKEPINWENVRARCARFDVIHSTDDAYVPVERAQNVAEKLGVELDLREGFGRFSSDRNTTELPLIFEKIR